MIVKWSDYIHENISLSTFSRDCSRLKLPPSQKFLYLWPLIHDLPTLKRIKLEAEYRFHPERKWRFDFALPQFQIAYEINGGGGGGYHLRMAGYKKDWEKYNTAHAMGWRVFAFTQSSFTKGGLDFTIYLLTEGISNIAGKAS